MKFLNFAVMAQSLTQTTGIVNISLGIFMLLLGISIGILMFKVFYHWKRLRDPTHDTGLHIHQPELLLRLEPKSLFYLCRMGVHGERFYLWIKNCTPESKHKDEIFFIQGPKDHVLLNSLDSGTYLVTQRKDIDGKSVSELVRYKDQTIGQFRSRPAGTWHRTAPQAHAA
jgi:hypothetical protein